MFGQIKAAAADLKDWAEDRIKGLTKCPCATEKENSPNSKINSFGSTKLILPFKNIRQMR